MIRAVFVLSMAIAVLLPASGFNRVGSLARRVSAALVVGGGFAVGQVQEMPAAAWVNLVPTAHAAETKKSVFEGEYTDPNHPDGMRKITVKGNDVTLTGTDSAGGKQWVLKAKESEGTIFVDFSPKGGPSNLLGVFDKDGITWPDGNHWTQKKV